MSAGYPPQRGFVNVPFTALERGSDAQTPSSPADAVKAAAEALAVAYGPVVQDSDAMGYPAPRVEALAAAAVDAAAPHLLAAHEAEVRAKVAAEQAAWECLDPWVCCVGAHYDSVHNPTTTEADA